MSANLSVELKVIIANDPDPTFHISDAKHTPALTIIQFENSSKKHKVGLLEPIEAWHMYKIRLLEKSKPFPFIESFRNDNTSSPCNNCRVEQGLIM